MAALRNPWNIMGPPDPKNPDEFYSQGMQPSIQPGPTDAATGALAGPPAPSITPDLAAPDLSMSRLAPVAPRSGLQEKRENDFTNLHKIDAQKILSMDPEQFDQAYRNVERTKAFQDQESGLKHLQEMMQLQNSRPLQLDLSPIAALTDAQTGSNFAQSYRKPQTGDDRMKQIMDYAQKVQGDQRDISNEIINAIGKQKGGTLTDIQQAIENQKNAELATDPFKLARTVPEETRTHWLQTSVEKQVKPLQSELESMQKGISQLQNATSVSDFSALDSYIKGQVGGRVTNFELARQTGGRGFEDRLDQALETIKSGTLSDTNRAAYRQAMQTILDATNREMELRMAQMHDVGKAYGLDEDKINLLTKGYSRKTSAPHAGHSAPAAKPAATGPSGAMSFDEWKKSQGNT